jgi:AMP-binding enzyme
VILSDPRGHPTATGISTRARLDELLRRAAARRPDAIALLDPPNRERFTDGKPRRLTYAQCDRMVSAIAGRLRRIGLHTDAIVAYQMVNCLESALTLLGILRAGLIAMPLPLLWRRTEMVSALGRVAPAALIVSGRSGEMEHYTLAMEVAAEVFPIRYVCGFGLHAPDGLVPLDDLFTTDVLDPIPAWEEERASEGAPSAHLAVITWDVSAGGLVPVARSHAEVLAGGLTVVLESRLSQGAVLLSSLTCSSFAGLASVLVPWLLLGSTLALHHPFDPEAYFAQLTSVQPDTLIVPGPVAVQLAESIRPILAGNCPDIIALWRSPERLARALPWRETNARFVDIQVFGEIAVIPACRGTGGKPAAVPFGVLHASHSAKGIGIALEIIPSPTGRVAVRGPMVPRATFPPGAERSGLPCLAISGAGFVDTGYACRLDSPTLLVTGPPPGIVTVGGYRFRLRELQEFVNRLENNPSLAALPDTLTGHRLVGNSPKPDATKTLLAELGANPLLVGAFQAAGAHAKWRTAGLESQTVATARSVDAPFLRGH